MPGRRGASVGPSAETSLAETAYDARGTAGAQKDRNNILDYPTKPGIMEAEGENPCLAKTPRLAVTRI